MLVGSLQNPTSDWVRVQFILAADALRRLPLTAFEKPQALRSGMPAFVRSKFDIFQAQVHADDQLRLSQKLEAEYRNETRECATDEQLAALNRVAEWLLWLTAEQQKVAMARAFDVSVETIRRRLRCSRPTVYSIERKAFSRIIAGIKDGRMKKSTVR